MKVLVTSDETGVVKQVICTKGTDTSQKEGVKPESITKYCNQPEPSLKSRVLHMSVVGSKLYTIRITGLLCIYDMDALKDDDFTLIKQVELCDDKPVALIHQGNTIIVGFESNKIFIVDMNGKIKHQFTIPYDKKVKPITSFVANPFKKGQFAIGGEENDVRLLEITDDITITHTYKNVPNDHLDLRVPISIKTIQFLTIDKFMTATKYGQIRLYDVDTIRPIGDFKIGNKPISQTVLCHNKQEVILSDTTNLIGRYSLVKFDSNATKINTATMGEITKSSVKLLGKYTGANTGATNALYNFNDKYIGCGGLDRYLRVFDLESRQLVAKVYLGTQVSSIIILEDDEEEEQPPQEEEAIQKRKFDDDDSDSDSEEEIWQQLEASKLKKKSRRAKPSN